MILLFSPLVLLLILIATGYGIFSFWTTQYFPSFDSYPDTQVMSVNRSIDFSADICQASYIHSESLKMNQKGTLLWLRVPDSWRSGRGNFHEYRTDGFHEYMIGNRFRTSTGIFIRENSQESNILVRNSLTVLLPDPACTLLK